jgi:hypothetical protein
MFILVRIASSIQIGCIVLKPEIFMSLSISRGVPRGDAQDARAPPLPPPQAMCIPPPHPQPERLVMRKDEAVGNKKKMQVCLHNHNCKLDNNLLTVEPRAVDPHCFDGDADADPDPDPAQNLDADPDPDPGGGGGRSAKNVHPPRQNPRYAPVYIYEKIRTGNVDPVYYRSFSVFFF